MFPPNVGHVYKNRNFYHLQGGRLFHFVHDSHSTVSWKQIRNYWVCFNLYRIVGKSQNFSRIPSSSIWSFLIRFLQTNHAVKTVFSCKTRKTLNVEPLLRKNSGISQKKLSYTIVRPRGQKAPWKRFLAVFPLRKLYTEQMFVLVHAVA